MPDVCVIPVFHRYYHAPTLSNGTMAAFPPRHDQLSSPAPSNASAAVTAAMEYTAFPESLIHCTRERPLLCLLLMLGTLWMGYTLYQFKRR